MAKIDPGPSCVIIKIDDTMTSHEKRRYELRKRADDVAATRLRITEAAIELHGSLGPARTTMTAVAQRAGVERRTLYRHFPNEAELFTACSAHYFAERPFPDPAGWDSLEQGLDELYAYYEQTAPMFANVLRDAETVDFAREAIAPLHAYLDEASTVLMAGRPRRKLVAGALRHALAFSTWQSLSANGIRRADAVRLMAALVGEASAH
jgi:AcrR family transcriptional regulator